MTPSACGYHIQADPEGDRSSNLTGPGVRAEGVDLNISLCSEMRTVNQYCWWHSREVLGAAAAGVVVVHTRETSDVRRYQSRPPRQKTSKPILCHTNDTENHAEQNGNVARHEVSKIRKLCAMPEMSKIPEIKRNVLRLWSYVARHHRRSQEASRATNQQSIHHEH